MLQVMHHLLEVRFLQALKKDAGPGLLVTIKVSTIVPSYVILVLCSTGFVNSRLDLIGMDL